MCKIVKITRASYYRWIKNGKRECQIDFDLSLAKKIQIIFNYHNGLYGSPQIKLILNRTMQISQSKIARYMRILGLKSKIRVKKRFEKPIEIKKRNSGYTKIVNSQWDLYQKNELWVTDVTYIKYSNKFVYLSILKGVKTGFIVGYKGFERNDNKLYMDTWKAAQHITIIVNQK
ncbi:IS3 family transposase [Spiroplasma endosymbiont of Aspidapion aeneum]|uniref:IS3 family transposase n=1 Tax=Spiroplasma endosymbiont of Aspidapion aeneum TaxID=3066276 RepID=UPI00313EF32F